MKHPVVLFCAAVLSGILCGLPEVSAVWKAAAVLVLAAAGVCVGIECRGKKSPLLFLMFLSIVVFFAAGFLRSRAVAADYSEGEKGSFFDSLKATNPGQFDYSIYLKAKGITSEEERVAAKETSTALQGVAACVIERNVNSEDGGVFRAMLAGDKTGLDEEVESLYQKSGISHLLAVSGLHVGMVGGAVSLVAGNILHLGRKANFLLSALLICLYTVMTGAGASCLRAAFMFLTGHFAFLCGRTYDPLTALSLIAAILALRFPYLVLQSGFQLSFTAVLGILAAGQLKPAEQLRLPPAEGRLSKVAESLRTSLMVTLTTLPPLLYAYYQIAPASFLLNLAVIPLMAVVMFSAFGVLTFGILEKFIASGSALTGIFHVLSVAAAAPGHYILRLYTLLCDLMQKLPFSQVTVGKPPALSVILFYLFLFLLTGFLRRRKKEKGKLAILFCFFLLSLAVLRVRTREAFSVTVLDVGQGDCFYIRYQDKNIVIDCGSSGYERAGSRILKPFLLSEGVTKLDAVIVSHADNDHVNGILYLLEEGGIEVRQLLLPALARQDEKYDQLLQAARQARVPVACLNTGSAFRYGKMSLSCIYVETDPAILSETNRESDVLLLECNGLKMLFTGDITEKEEQKILQLYEKNSVLEDIDVLKCAHHGSKTASCQAFLQQLQPRLAILSYGKNNRYGHPAKEVVQRLEETEALIWYTGKQGAGKILPEKDTGFCIRQAR